MSEPPANPPNLPPQASPPPPAPPLEYQGNTFQRPALGPAFAFVVCMCGCFPLTFGLYCVLPHQTSSWLPPLLAFLLMGSAAGLLRSPMGFLGALVALVLTLMGCGLCAGILNSL
jgi:hypothetical protein